MSTTANISSSSSSSSVSSPRVIGGEPTAKDLAVASRDGNLEVVKALIAKGISCNEICEFGGTAMHQAATSGQNEVVTFLIDSQQADVEKVTAGGATALHLATEKNHEAVVSTLCAKGAKLEAVDRVRRK
jgi:ankyrin repeat protein